MAFFVKAGLLWSLLFALICSAAGTAQLARRSGDATMATTSALPTLTLNYGRYAALAYNPTASLYTFRNIRYANAPTGTGRWMPPVRPSPATGTVTPATQFSPTLACVQPGTTTTTGPTPTPTLPGSQEDCLFLDLYVPAQALKSAQNNVHNYSVVVWIHGGSALRGSKNQAPGGFLYDGTGPVTASNNSIIFVAGNYRLGYLGFLAGNTMEQNALPNAGLHDQRAIFQWVQDFIYLVGGNNSSVTAWGESAGADSLKLQTVAEGGTLDPLFRNMFLQSPSNTCAVDRRGDMEQNFQDFSNHANCSTATNKITCLQSQNISTLYAASNASGPGFGADGTFIRQAPELEYATGNYWKKLNSVILSHVGNESGLFLKPLLYSDAGFQFLVESLLPSSATAAVASIVSEYPSPNGTTPYTTQAGRQGLFIQDYDFMHPQHIITLAYALSPVNVPVWKMQYNIPSASAALHDSDLIPLFYNPSVTNHTVAASGDSQNSLPANITSLAAAYQAYAVSAALTGNPNTFGQYSGATYGYSWIQWKQPTAASLTQQYFNNVLMVNGSGLSLSIDYEINEHTTAFFQQISINVTDLLGYAVPSSNPTTPSSPATPNPALPSSFNYTNQCVLCYIAP